MSRAAEKRLAEMRVSPGGWRYEEVAGILDAYGFVKRTSSGSHRLFKHPSGVRVGLVEKDPARSFPCMSKRQ